MGYFIDSRVRAGLAVSALRNAIGLRDPAPIIVDFERNSQFRSRALVRAPANNELVGSMGQVGALSDNAAILLCFSSATENVWNRRRWDRREEPRLAIVTCIERTHFGRRRYDAAAGSPQQERTAPPSARARGSITTPPASTKHGAVPSSNLHESI